MFIFVYQYFTLNVFQTVFFVEWGFSTYTRLFTSVLICLYNCIKVLIGNDENYFVCTYFWKTKKNGVFNYRQQVFKVLIYKRSKGKVSHQKFLYKNHFDNNSIFGIIEVLKLLCYETYRSERCKHYIFINSLSEKCKKSFVELHFLSLLRIAFIVNVYSLSPPQHTFSISHLC